MDHAYEKVIAVFADWELTPPGEQSHLHIQREGGSIVLDIRRDVVPSIAFALRYFGDSLPDPLIKKLRNGPQTQDTLFELLCLGFLGDRNKVVYEPKLADGKVPDLLLELDGGPPIYVECKSHGFSEAGYWNAFQEVTSQVFKAFEGQPVAKSAEEQKLRIELFLNARPNGRELKDLKGIVPTLSLADFHSNGNIAKWMSVAIVPQTQPVRSGFSMTTGIQLIGLEPTRVSQQDGYLLVYPWPALDKQRLASQRGLLRSARVQLRDMPAGALGMICFQTVASKRFLPELHRLIDQDQFTRIPIVWLNPSLVPGMESKVVFRDGARNLVDRLISS